MYFEEVSFYWTYYDKETYLFFSTEVMFILDAAEPGKLDEDYYVIFPVGMDWKWEVDKAVLNYYRFADQILRFIFK